MVNFEKKCRGDATMIDVKSDGSEVLTYSVGKLPVKAFKASRKEVPMLSVINHWHDDFELTVVLSGSMTYNVNGEGYEITEGQMLFVNARQMHFNVWKEEDDCEYICLVIHPSLLFSLPYMQPFYEQLSGENAVPFLIFSPSSARQREIIDKVLHLYEMTEKEGYEMEITGELYHICNKLIRYLQSTPEGPITDNKKLKAMHKMVGFIQQNYTDKISLNEIAAAGLVCRSRCCEMFKEFWDKSPNEYLTEYRIAKSIELFADNALSMTEIALMCGFNGSSYYAETFKKQIGCTPSEYRRKFL